jgi:glycerol kinase
MGWYDHAKETEGMATSVDDTHGVYFVPAFSGLAAPHQGMLFTTHPRSALMMIEPKALLCSALLTLFACGGVILFADPTARGTILGMTTSTKKQHLVRAMLESIVR